VPEQFYSFDEALNQLNLREEELKRLVSEGEIRAFREGDTMKLRRADVENLKKELMGGEVVDLGGAGEDLVFEDDLDLEEAGMATEEISDMDTLLDEGVEDVGEVEIETAEVAVAAPARPVQVRRTAVVVEEASEGMLVRVLALVTSVILLLAVPVAISVSKGNPSGLAKSIASKFPGANFRE
jgi:excisionase family DNA binding protein